MDGRADDRLAGLPGPCCSPGSWPPSSGSSHPLLPLRVILDRTRGGAYVSVGMAGIAIFGMFLFLTYYLQAARETAR